MGEVVEIGGITALDLPPDRVLRRALDADLESVVIVGYTKDGQEYFCSSIADVAMCMYHLQRGIWSLNRIVDEMSE
jgi:hypothetical protein